jgi:hypothetical protein
MRKWTLTTSASDSGPVGSSKFAGGLTDRERFAWRDYLEYFENRVN